MAKKERGYVKLYRSMQDNWLWNEEPFSRGQAWIDLLLSVNHEDKKILINNQIIVIHAGQRWTSYRTLAKQWHWSRDRVKRFIDLLKSDGMIHTNETPHGTLLTVVNWDNFNGACDTDKSTHKATHKATDETTGKATDKATDKDETITKKNDKNDKNEKEIGFGSADYIEPPHGGGVWQ